MKDRKFYSNKQSVIDKFYNRSKYFEYEIDRIIYIFNTHWSNEYMITSIYLNKYIFTCHFNMFDVKAKQSIKVKGCDISDIMKTIKRMFLKNYEREQKINKLLNG
jgi:hypothetical protein